MAVKEQYIVNPDGMKKAVVVPLSRYKKIMEDLHDLAVIVERRKEPSVKSADFMKKLRQDGIL